VLRVGTPPRTPKRAFKLLRKEKKTDDEDKEKEGEGLGTQKEMKGQSMIIMMTRAYYANGLGGLHEM